MPLSENIFIQINSILGFSLEFLTSIIKAAKSVYPLFNSFSFF